MLTINGISLQDYNHPFIVAEASANHAQSLALAHRLVDAAADAGADAVKFQLFSPEELATDVPILTGYDWAHDAWLHGLGVTRLHELFARGGLPRPWHKELKQHAESRGIAFLCTPFSVDAAKFLVEDIGVQALKIASGDLTFTPLLAYASSTRLPVILSTGMAVIDEIEQAMTVLDWGFTVLLHCKSRYPHGPEEANLRAIPALRQRFQLPVGYSDHTTDYCQIPAQAVTLGCCVYEKHLCLADGPLTPDTQHSLNEHQFTEMVRTIRKATQALGDGNRSTIDEADAHERLWGRRSKTDWKRPTDRARQGQWA